MKRQGFTLIELIIVIAIISLLAGGIFVALNPAKRLTDTRNANRWQSTQSLLDAVKLFQIDNDGSLPTGVDTTLRMIGTDASGCNISCGGTSSSPTDISVRVATGRDDAEERNPPNGNISRSSSDLELVNDGSTDQEVGIRFQNITIPQGATISSATIEFTVDETNSGATNLIFYGDDTDNSPQFLNSSGDITDRTKTTANIAWNSLPAWSSVGATHQTPDISSIVQEIVNRSGWSSGNSLSIIVDGTGERTAESYNGSSSQAPLLSTTYTTSTGETTDSACLDLSTDLSPYLKIIPKDPTTGSTTKTYYAIKQTTEGVINITSCSAEEGESISKTI